MTNCTAVNTPPIFQAIKETESKKTYRVFQPFSRDPYSYRLDRSIGVDDSSCLTDTTHRDIISMSLEPLEASEHIKHRRTRSGCFTCRARRVKCDEARPTCDRCSKGNRQCTFPESAETPKSSRVKRRTSGQAGVKVGACAEIPRSKNIKEERTPISASYEISFPDESQSRTFPKSACHIAHKSGNSWERRIIDTSTSSLNELNVESHDFWLDFFRDNITFRHYFLTEDKHDFLHLTLPILAQENQALLFSMISLSAFHFFIGSPASSQYSGANQVPEIRSTEIFFQLHNKAIMLLRSSFQESPVPSLYGLLAVLHLSLVEEYLGQWENMIQHRRGACMILSSLFDPESINDSPEGRFVYSWVTRFDLTISMWCGLSTALEQHWYMADYQKTRLQWSQEFAEPERLVAAAKSTSQYITMQIVNLLEARFSGIYDYDTYQQAVNSAMEEIDGFWATFSPDNISELLGYLDTRAGLVSSHNLLRYTYCEVHVMKLLLQHQQSVVQSCSQDIYSVCGLVCDLIWEILHSWDNKQGLLLLPLQMTLALLAAFCKDDQLRDFLGAQFNTMECVGFVYPATYRSRISSLWQDPTIKSGWRDHAESQICLLTTIRTLAQATSDAHSSMTGNSLMRNMFSFANINPHSSQSSTSVIFDIPYTLASEDQI